MAYWRMRLPLHYHHERMEGETDMREYSKAIADKSAPARWPEDTAQAFAAKDHGEFRCLQAKSVYEWANKHGVNLITQGWRIRKGDVLLLCVINDMPLEWGEQQQ